MTDTTHPPCDADQAPLPPRGTRVQRATPPRRGRLGVVHDTDPVGSRLLVLVDGGMFADWYHASDWAPVGPDEDDAGWDEDEDPNDDLDYEDDGFAEHDADDALYDARREEARS